MVTPSTVPCSPMRCGLVSTERSIDDGIRGTKARDVEEPAATVRRGAEADSADPPAVPRFTAVFDAAGLFAAPIPVDFPGTASRRREAKDGFEIRTMFTLSLTSTGSFFRDGAAL